MKEKNDIQLLDDSGIEYSVLNHRAVFSVAESAEVMPDKFPVKNLFITDQKKTNLFMVVMKGDERLDMKLLSEQLEVGKLSFGRPELLLSVLGVTPGSVSVLNMIGVEGIELLVDERLVGRDDLGFHPDGDNTRTVMLSYASLKQLLAKYSVEIKEVRL